MALIRFIGTLKLLKKIIVPTSIVILCAAATPSYFLWFLGKTVDCTLQSGCQVTHDLLGWQVILPLTTSSLLAIAVVAMFCRVAAWTMFELSGQWSTQEIQAQMMKSICKVRTSFFDENPSGRLINRLLGDYGMLRLDGVMSIGDTANSFADVICVGLLIMIAHPIAGLLILPVILLYVGLQTQLAPMMSHARELRAVKIGEALHRETDLIEGRTMFTLYNKVDNLLERIYKAFNNSLNIQLFYAKLMSWGMLWMGVISAIYAVVVYAFLIVGMHNQTVSVTVAAVVITAVFNLNNLFFGLSWDMSFLGETASHARRAFYIIDLPDETEQESHAPQIVDDAPMKPLKGNIRFENYSMSYREHLPRILTDLNLEIPMGLHVGIVGRTGAGKTSLMQALFRLVYHHGGDIKVGGRSIFGLDVSFLRSHFGVVPQDPYLFAGTIRFNLAGTMDLPDDHLRSALDRVGLKVGLDATVLEGGKDYSVGERQLLCLARLILNRKSYIFMDEPTSSLDRRTDEKIQQLLQTKMSDRTVITIAHRLESLFHYDLIMELSEGKLVRQGPPGEMIPLLQSVYGNIEESA